MENNTQNKDLSRNDGNTMLNEALFKVGDRVKSYSRHSYNECGVVWKVSEKAVHVRFDRGLFQKFHFNSKHHMQTKIERLKHLI